MMLPHAALGPVEPDPTERRLKLLRTVSIAITMTIAILWAISIAPRYGQYRTLDSSVVSDPAIVRANLAALGLSVRFFAWYNLALEIFSTLVFGIVAAVLLLRRSSGTMALVVALFLVALGTGFPGTINGLSSLSSVFSIALRCLDNLSWLSFAYVCYLLPDGRFVPRWTRWVGIVLTIQGSIDALFPRLMFGASDFLPFVLLLFLSIAISGIYAQVYRYRRVSDTMQRQQTKWVALGMAVAISSFVVLAFLPAFVPSLGERGSLYDLVAPAAVNFSLLLIPVALLLAVLRYRLYDIDLLINRALVYGLLSASLVLVYVATVVLLQQGFHSLTGQHSDVVVVISTLVSAALAQPLRRRLQQLIDRRFYRHKYDAAHTVASFAAQMHEETSLTQLSRDLIAVVQETVQPEGVSLWLRSPTRMSRDVGHRDEVEVHDVVR